MHTIILSGNCFWALQAVFAQIKGISDIECGCIWMEAGLPPKSSAIPWPAQQMEVIRCQWNPDILFADNLVRVLLNTTSAGLASWNTISELSGMRSLIAQISEEFHDICWAAIADVAREQNTAVHTQLVSDTLKFQKAAGADQNFFVDHPNDQYSCGIIAPKLQRVRQRFAHLIKP